MADYLEFGIGLEETGTTTSTTTTTTQTTTTTSTSTITSTSTSTSTTTTNPPGSMCAGHDTAVEEDYTIDHADGSGTGTVSGSGDDEILTLDPGEYWEYPTWYYGIGNARIFKDKYQTGSGTIVVKYRTEATKAATEVLGWTVYSGEFNSLGWVGIKVEG